MSNPVLKKLGLSENDKAFVLHADDIGLLQATIPAYLNLMTNQRITAASVMVPAPWYPAAIEAIQQSSNLPQSDVGVHITLNSEWTSMRYGPITPEGRNPDNKLIDEAGYFHPIPEVIQNKGSVETVENEAKQQVSRAQQDGIDITHIDSHMGTVIHPRFLPTYIGIAMRARIPAFALRLSEKMLLEAGFDPDTAKLFSQHTQQLEAAGYPLFDSYRMLPLREAQSFEERLAYAKRYIDNAPAGLHYLIIHPALDTPELRAVAPDWEARSMDYTLFMSDAWDNMLTATGVKTVSMRSLRGIMRGEAPSQAPAS